MPCWSSENLLFKPFGNIYAHISGSLWPRVVYLCKGFFIRSVFLSFVPTGRSRSCSLFRSVSRPGDNQDLRALNFFIVFPPHWVCLAYPYLRKNDLRKRNEGTNNRSPPVTGHRHQLHYYYFQCPSSHTNPSHRQLPVDTPPPPTTTPTTETKTEDRRQKTTVTDGMERSMNV